MQKWPPRLAGCNARPALTVVNIATFRPDAVSAARPPSTVPPQVGGCLCSLTASNSAMSGRMVPLQPPVFQHSFSLDIGFLSHRAPWTLDNLQFNFPTTLHLFAPCSLLSFFSLFYTVMTSPGLAISLFLSLWFALLPTSPSRCWVSYFSGHSPLLVNEMRAVSHSSGGFCNGLLTPLGR